jgi:DHA1 family bicyclomycin/chloramphenicol resistance-like MFS transporter
MASFFAFLANSPFVYMTHYGLSETQYGIAFGVNAVSFIGASQLASGLGARFGMTRMVMTAVAVYAASAVTMLVVFAAGVDSLAVLMVMMFFTNGWLGLVIPTSMVLALEDHGPVAGIASALGGTLQMVLGGIVMAIASLFGQASALPMVAAIAVCAVLAFALSQLTLRTPSSSAQPAG